MAAKSRIDIDVNSAEFLEFKAKFDQYVGALGEIPESWKKIGQSTSVAKTNFESMAGSMAVVGASFAAISKSADEFYRVTTATGRHWKDLALSTGSVAKNIVAATESLLKWSGIIGLVTGGGGLFGFDRLAHSVANQRTAALGTGGDYGKRAAFTTAFKRFGDPESLLGRVSQDQANFGRELRKLGLTEQDMKGDPADVALKAMRAGAKIAEADLKIGNLATDPRLALFGSVEERRRLIALQKSGELEAGGKFVQENANKLNLPPPILRAYTDFVQKMELAGKKIEKIFVEGLVGLADPLGRLSADVVSLTQKFMEKGGPLDALIADLSSAIEWLAGEIDKPEFKKGVGDFLSDIGSLVSSLGGLVKGLSDFAKWLGVSPAGTEGFSGNSLLPSSLSAPGTGIPASSLGGHERISGQRGTFGHRGFSGGGGTSAPISGAEASKNAQESWNFWKSKGYSDDAAAAMLAMERGESGFKPNAVGDHGRSVGAFQWDPTRRAAIQSATGINVGTASHADELRAADWETTHGDPGAQRFHKHLMSGESVERMVGSGISDFERSGNQQRDYGIRLPYARSAKEQFSKKVTISSTPGGNTVSGANAAAAGSP